MSTLQFRLKSGERLFVNGAVLRVDRKVAIEFLNDVTFLLDNHVLQIEDAKTPLKQLYFMIQLMLISPAQANEIQPTLDKAMIDIMVAFENEIVLAGLAEVGGLLKSDRFFESLKVLRRLFPLEAKLIGDSIENLPVLDETLQCEGVLTWK